MTDAQNKAKLLLHALEPLASVYADLQTLAK
jgi:hypothetical protein